jgi:pimeloyl-ACP methyl ester carboxylesterase
VSSAAIKADATGFTAVSLPLWREAFFGLEWLSLRVSPVYYGFGIPRGDGAPVVVVPGFLGSDSYLSEMHNWLKRINYKPYYSGIGRNAECPELLTERLVATIDTAWNDTHRKVRLVGHSLGGTLARVAAGRRPNRVNRVITLASPIQDIRVHGFILAAAGVVRQSVIERRKKQAEAHPQCYTESCTCGFGTQARGDLPATVKTTAIYSKGDGVIDWRVCLDEDPAKNIEVEGTHVGLAFNAEVYRHIARLLASR